MSHPDLAIRAIHAGISILLLIGVLVLWRSYRVDALRDRLFALRQELFDFAKDGNVAFADPAYTRLRFMMNAMIRFAHRVTLLRLVVSLAAFRVLGLPSADLLEPLHTWTNAVNRLPQDAVRERLIDFHRRMLVLVVRHMLTGSPVLWVFLVALGSWIVLSGATKRVIEGVAERMQRRLPGLDLLEGQAFLTG